MTSLAAVSDERAEQLVCCGLMSAPDLLAAHVGTLAPADFYHAPSRALAFALLPAARLGEPTDPRTAWLLLEPVWHDVWPDPDAAWDFVTWVGTLDPTGAWADAAAARVRWLARRREAVHTYRRLIRDALSGEGEFAPDDAESLSGLALTEADCVPP